MAILFSFVSIHKAFHEFTKYLNSHKTKFSSDIFGKTRGTVLAKNHD